ncbi:MAG TPA: xanthine dehydrogenase family protein subunit M [Arenibaculum sp.]|nr:xanthine dehydrogenase family protein subunit M [Arenibaculum sp.]
MGSYLRPVELVDALAFLRQGPRLVVAGGTDVYPRNVGHPPTGDLLDITGVEELRGIHDDGTHVRLGALVTWSDLMRARLPPWFDGLRRAAREVGGIQVQNAGTLAGNVCNASPAADGMPNLLALDALVEIVSSDATRRVPVADFVVGNRRTLLRPDELVTAILIPKPMAGARSTFLKLGARRYLVISIVMVAAVLEPASDGTVGRLRIAVGACSEVARRLIGLEQHLAGRPIGPALCDLVEPGHLAALAPIDDVRAGSAYRLDAALVLVRRCIERLVAGGAGASGGGEEEDEGR